MIEQKRDKEGRHMAMERLDKILAGTGRWSRKEVRELAKLGA